MFSKKISLFVVPFLSIMILANLFVIPIYADDFPTDEPIGNINEGELIYLIAQANGIKLTGDKQSVINGLNKDYSRYQSFNKFLPSLKNLIGTIYRTYKGTTYFNCFSNVYNAIANYLRNSLVPFGYNVSNDYNLVSLRTGFNEGGYQYNGLYSFYPFLGDGRLALGRDFNYSRNNCGLNLESQPAGCSYESNGLNDKIYLFYDNTNYYFASKVKVDKLILHHYYDSNTKLFSYNILQFRQFSLSNGYYMLTVPRVSSNDYPYLYKGAYMIYKKPSSLNIYETIAYLLNNYNYGFDINYSQDFNISNIYSSTTNVVINNINIVNNNVVINNNGTDVPIDDTYKDTTVTPMDPEFKPVKPINDLYNIDTIDNIHNDMEVTINDFLTQFNDNLNKIDTNCYSLTSCAINGLKSVGNSINDVTGFTEKGMNSDIVLLICLFLLLGILFTIL